MINLTNKIIVSQKIIKIIVQTEIDNPKTPHFLGTSEKVSHP